MTIHRIKSMWYAGGDEVLLTHCGVSGFIVEEKGDVVKAQTPYDYVCATMGNHGDMVDCPKCLWRST